jgi:antitoxin component YwqK of YwqJK toxin-antitoxin module
MKKLLVLLLLSASVPTFASGLDFLFESFCYKSPKVQNRNGVFYLPNQQEPVTAENLCVYKGNGQYASKGNILNGLRDGKWTYWHENGQIRELGNYKDGRDEGKWTIWFDNGRKQFEAYYKDGKADGKVMQWLEDGQVDKISNSRDGVLVSWIEYEYYDNGQMRVEVPYNGKGQVDGKVTMWHENGQKHQEKIFVGGNLNGRYIEWYKNGQMKWDKNWIDDKEVG